MMVLSPPSIYKWYFLWCSLDNLFLSAFVNWARENLNTQLFSIKFLDKSAPLPSVLVQAFKGKIITLKTLLIFCRVIRWLQKSSSMILKFYEEKIWNFKSNKCVGQKDVTVWDLGWLAPRSLDLLRAKILVNNFLTKAEKQESTESW